MGSYFLGLKAGGKITTQVAYGGYQLKGPGRVHCSHDYVRRMSACPHPWREEPHHTAILPGSERSLTEHLDTQRI